VKRLVIAAGLAAAFALAAGRIRSAHGLADVPDICKGINSQDNPILWWWYGCSGDAAGGGAGGAG
jgi:hypothetical protein